MEEGIISKIIKNDFGSGDISMKKFFLTGIAAAALFGTSALAADLPTKAPISRAAPAAPLDWTGPYAGIAGGWSWGNSDQTDPGVLFGDGNYNVSGGLIGGTLGYNWQNGQWVFGLEGDYSWADIKGQSSLCGFPVFTHSCGTKIETFGTARARVGAVMGNQMPYITGGWAFGDVHGWDSFFPASGSKMYSGWTIGAGIEWRLDPRWSAKIEYLYADLGKHQLFYILPAIPETVSASVNIVRIGLNYKFGDWGKAPVSAKY